MLATNQRRIQMLPFSTYNHSIIVGTNQELLASSPCCKMLLFTNDDGNLYLSKQTDADDFIIAAINENDANSEIHGSNNDMTLADAVKAGDVRVKDYLDTIKLGADEE